MNRSIKTAIVLFVVALVFSVIVFSQVIQPQNSANAIVTSEGKADWTKVYGGSGDDRLFYALPVGSNYFVVGSTKSDANGTLMGWALMINGEGGMIWNHTYLDGAGTEIRQAVTLPDGFLLVGNQFTSDDQNGYVAKVDLDGRLIWQTVIGGAKIDKLFSGVASGDGFIVCGLSYSYGDGHSQAWAVKLGSAGSTVWNRIYDNGNEDCALRSTVASVDGGCVAAGYIDSENGKYGFYLQKIGADGNCVWNRTYSGSGSEKAYSLATTPDGYVLAGDVTLVDSSTDAFVVRVNSDGTLVWTKAVGGGNYDSASYITQAKDGGYLVCGFTFSWGEGNRDFWLFSISDQGTVGFSCTYGNSAYQEAYSVAEAGDGKYVLFGWTDPIGQQNLVGKATYDYYIVKLSPV